MDIVRDQRPSCQVRTAKGGSAGTSLIIFGQNSDSIDPGGCVDLRLLKNFEVEGSLQFLKEAFFSPHTI